MRPTAKLLATEWSRAAAGTDSYASVTIVCPCAACADRDNGPRVLFRNDDALALFVLNNDMTDASVRDIVRRSATRSAMRHVVAGDDRALFLGCAVTNNRLQQTDDVPAVGRIVSLSDIDNGRVRDDASRCSRDEQKRD